MSVRWPRKKIIRAITLSGLLCVCLLPPAGAQIIVQAEVPQSPAAENDAHRIPAEQAPAATDDPHSVSAEARPLAQASPDSSRKKDTAQAGPAKKPVRARPHAQIKGQTPKSPLQVPPAASATSAPAVPGVNDFAPGKIVVSNGGAQEVRLQLTPTATPAEAAQQRQQIRNLIFITDENLKRIAGHDLDANQQDMLGQVHNYMTQARAADKAGELQRAQILASKARQLSDDLAGVRTILKLWPW